MPKVQQKKTLKDSIKQDEITSPYQM